MKHTSAIHARIRIVSADLENDLRKLTQCGITLQQVIKENDLTARICVKTTDYKETVFLLKQWNLSYQLLDRQEGTDRKKNIISRFVLVAAFMLLLAASLYLPEKILFVYVSGNDNVPARKIVDEAMKAGVCFGATAADVRSEKVKNTLLESIPELQWIGVNTSGCVATIHVKEKSDAQKNMEQKYAVTSIVASSDGIIEACTVTKGTKLCAEGQAVREGDTLISGYTDCGIIIKATQAQGEVYAQTLRKITALLPSEYASRGDVAKETVVYSLRIGKKLINFNNNSGIYHGRCAKIYEEMNVMLPGGFVLPISLIKETFVLYDAAGAKSLAEQGELLLQAYGENYLHAHMLAGSIKHGTLHFRESEDAVILNGQYTCSEMIGRQKEEEILQGD